MFQNRWIGLIILTIILSQGCATYEPIKIQALIPSEIKISPDIYKVVLIDHADYKRSPSLSKTDENIVNGVDSISSNQYFSGLLNSISNSPRFQLVSFSPIYIPKPNYNERFQKLDWSIIQKICTDSSADAAIVLENYQVSYNPIKLTFSRDYGYFGSLQVINNSLWKIYVPASNDIAEDYFQKDTLLWDGSGNYAAEVYEQIPEVTDAAVQSCYYAGIKYGKRIAQTWTTLNRYLITCENEDFIRAIQFVRAQQWNDAIVLWKKYTYSKSKRLAAYSAYNMSVASETYDNIDAALEWASKSFLLNRDEFTEKYITILESRKKQKEIINSQLEK